MKLEVWPPVARTPSQRSRVFSGGAALEARQFNGLRYPLSADRMEIVAEPRSLSFPPTPRVRRAWAETVDPDEHEVLDCN